MGWDYPRFGVLARRLKIPAKSIAAHATPKADRAK